MRKYTKGLFGLILPCGLKLYIFWYGDVYCVHNCLHKCVNKAKMFTNMLHVCTWVYTIFPNKAYCRLKLCTKFRWCVHKCVDVYNIQNCVQTVIKCVHYFYGLHSHSSNFSQMLSLQKKPASIVCLTIFQAILLWNKVFHSD